MTHINVRSSASRRPEQEPKPPTGGMINLIIASLLLVLTGCATVPFDPEPKADLRDADPVELVEQFDAVVGKEFEQLQSVIFKFFTKGFTGLGYLSVEPVDSAYALTCMTPTGVTIFGLQGQGEEVQPTFVPPQMEQHQDKIFPAIARDLRRVYLNWIPPANAEVKHKKNHIVFRTTIDEEKVEWYFSGPRKVLTKKQFKTGWGTDCIVTYYDYEEVNGKLYPMGIVLYNKSFRYRMIFRVKEIYPVNAGAEE